MGVPHDHRMYGRVRIKNGTGLILEVQKIGPFLGNGLECFPESEKRRRSAHHPCFDEIKQGKQDESQGKDRIKDESQEGENLDRADLVQIESLPLEAIDDLQDVNTAPRDIENLHSVSKSDEGILEIQLIARLELIAVTDLEALFEFQSIPVHNDFDPLTLRATIRIPFPDDPLPNLREKSSAS